jgi:hypothetical protein
VLLSQMIVAGKQNFGRSVHGRQQEAPSDHSGWGAGVRRLEMAMAAMAIHSSSRPRKTRS